MANPIADSQPTSAKDTNARQPHLDALKSTLSPENDPNRSTETVASTAEPYLSLSSVFPEAFGENYHNEDENIPNPANKDALDQTSESRLRLADELEDHARSLRALAREDRKLRDRLRELAVGIGHLRREEVVEPSHDVEPTAASHGSRGRRRQTGIEGSG